jgi:cysteine synthase
LIAGLAAYVKEVAPHVKVIGVEAEGANLLEKSLEEGSLVSIPSVNRFTEEVGIQTLGTENFRLCKKLVDEVVTVSTDEICSAIKDVFGDTRSLMEPTGACALLIVLWELRLLLLTSVCVGPSRCDQCGRCQEICSCEERAEREVCGSARCRQHGLRPAAFRLGAVRRP